MLSRAGTGIKIVAAVLGVLVTGGPVLWFNAWLKKQGEDEATLNAQWIMTAAERQVGQAIALIRDLGVRGVDTCRPAHVEAMREQVYISGAIKELLLISPSGQVLCTDAGAPAGWHKVVGSAVTVHEGVTLEAVRMNTLGDRFLRIRMDGRRGRPGHAALMPASALLPNALLQNGRLLSYANFALSDGTAIGGSGVDSEADYAQALPSMTRASSPLYGFTVTVAMNRHGIVASYDDLRRIASVVTGVFAIMLLMAAAVVPWRRRHPVGDMAKAIMAGEFVPYLQPVVDIQSGRLLGAEVLARWRRPDGSLVQPGAFIPMMETSGLIVPLTRALMTRVRDELGEEIGRREGMSVAFNIAPSHLEDGLILNDIGTIFGNSPIRMTQVVLELTERHRIENLTATRRVIAALQGLGCKVAIDDVGAGHSGLSYILKLGVDIIKIDKIFVDGIGSESHSRTIIQTLIDLARNMRMDIVAEGVETFDQVSYLRENGIGAAQGYVFAPPLPMNSFLDLLKAMDPLSRPAAAADGEGDRVPRPARRRAA